MIPEEINVLCILKELHVLGWKDSMIEIECGYTKGYVAQIRCGSVQMPSYPKAAKLLNLLERVQATLRAT